jgi:hypothetical protein
MITHTRRAGAEFARSAAFDAFPPPSYLRGEFPGTPVVERLDAVTVFTSYQRDRNVDGSYGWHGALCACGGMWQAEARHLLRKAISGHRCVDNLDGPVELVPVDDHLSTEDVERLLAGLRALA